MGLILLKPGDTEFLGRTAGPSTDVVGSPEEFAGSIELISMRFGMKQQISKNVGNSARTSGRPTLSEISLVKRSDQSSILFYEACLIAKPIGAGTQVTKILVAPGSNENRATDKFLTIELTDALVSGIEMQSDPDGSPTDLFTLDFTEIRWVWSSAKSGDLKLDEFDFGWSVASNRPA